ncbi:MULTISPECIES: XdhC family protein [unclassified Streptomyces]|uniref:XdhC family protein n=1 Tax=unclassified Streptomyces TaxID=2593676 RepID=UPI002E78B380|nr:MULTISPECIES: XdhC/CoxI family protein [unclassified Streptomyces]MEE1765067.1 XdhC family protein [Streptomyces sp. SP18BB07]MEE1837742.1 XdhC family protein [Streptomyces sp. SP17KL33]
MLDLATELSAWAEEGRDFAVATVVAVGGSAPRGPGAALAVDGEGTVIGSVSGGCVEGAVYELCRQALADGETVLQRFGYSDEDAFAVGLTCGGVIDILVTPVTARSPARAVLRAALSAAAAGEPTAVARVVRGPAELLGQALLVRTAGVSGEPHDRTDAEEHGRAGGGARAGAAAYDGGLAGHRDLDRTAAAEARAMLDAGRTGTIELSPDGSHCPDGLTLLVETRVPPPRMIVFGAIDFAAALVRAGKFLGYHVTVCDARPVFVTRARFPEADEIVVDWPHRYLRRTDTDSRTVLCVLTHDAKFDVPLLKEALRMPVAFVGAMGSRRTHTERDRRLREVGLTERELARLRSPIGLDLGARTPEETALSIAAEIVAARRGGTGVPLTGSGMPIHREAGERGTVAAA